MLLQPMFRLNGLGAKPKEQAGDIKNTARGISPGGIWLCNRSSIRKYLEHYPNKTNLLGFTNSANSDSRSGLVKEASPDVESPFQ